MIAEDLISPLATLQPALRAEPVKILPYAGTTKEDLLQYNQIVGTRFISLQESVIEIMVTLGWPLIDFIEHCDIKKPKDPRVSPEQKKKKHRKGKVTYPDIRHLLLRLNSADNACKLGSVSECLPKFDAISNFLREFDFSLIAKIFEAMDKKRDRADYSSIWKIPGLEFSTTSRAELYEKYDEALEMRGNLISANINLAHSQAQRWATAQSSMGSLVPIEDFTQEGMLGLIDGLNKLPWEWENGETKISTIGCWWIKFRIGRYYQDKSNVIRIPNNLQPIALKVKQAILDLHYNGNMNPSSGDISRKIGIPESRVISAMAAMACQRLNSLDAPRGNHDDGGDSYDYVDPKEGNASFNTSEIVETREQLDQVFSVLNRMPAELSFIVSAKMGLAELSRVSITLAEEMIQDSKARDMELLERIPAMGLQVSRVNLSAIPSELLQ